VHIYTCEAADACLCSSLYQPLDGRIASQPELTMDAHDHDMSVQYVLYIILIALR